MISDKKKRHVRWLLEALALVADTVVGLMGKAKREDYADEVVAITQAGKAARTLLDVLDAT